MKNYKVVLTKSYIVKIKAENKNSAKEFSEFYTNDIQNISSVEDELKNNFKIEDIDCKINEAIEVIEDYENN